MSEVFKLKEEQDPGIDDMGPMTEILNQVSSCKVQYFKYDPAAQSYNWEESWDQLEQNQGLPVAIKIDFGFIDGEEEYNVSRTITIPVTK